jgi:hypothetical protein
MDVEAESRRNRDTREPIGTWVKPDSESATEGSLSRLGTARFYAMLISSCYATWDHCPEDLDLNIKVV